MDHSAACHSTPASTRSYGFSTNSRSLVRIPHLHFISAHYRHIFQFHTAIFPLPGFKTTVEPPTLHPILSYQHHLAHNATSYPAPPAPYLPHRTTRRNMARGLGTHVSAKNKQRERERHIPSLGKVRSRKRWAVH